MSPWAKFIVVALGRSLGVADAEVFLSTEMSSRRQALVVDNQSTGCIVELSTVHYDCHERETDVPEHPVTLQFGLDCREMQEHIKLDVTDVEQQCARLELATSGSKTALPSSRSFRLEKGDFANLRCFIFPLKLLWRPDDDAFRFDLTLSFALQSASPSAAKSKISQISLVQVFLTSSVEIAESKLQEDCKKRLQALYEWGIDEYLNSNGIEICWVSPIYHHSRNVLRVMVESSERWKVISRLTYEDLKLKVLKAEVELDSYTGHKDVREHLSLKAGDPIKQPFEQEACAEFTFDDDLPPKAHHCQITLGYSYPGGEMERMVIDYPLSLYEPQGSSSKRMFFKLGLCILALLVATAALYYCRCYRSRAAHEPRMGVRPPKSARSMNIELS